MRRIALLVIGATTTLLCACGDTKVIDGAPALEPATASPTPTSVSSLRSALDASAKTITSEHLVFTTTANLVSATGHGDETVLSGNATTADITETAVGSTQRVIDDGGDAMYVQRPASLIQTGKPWQAVSDSSNSDLRSISENFMSLERSVQPNSALDYVLAATTTSAGTPETVNGGPATHYVLSVDTSRMPGGQPGDPTDAHLDLWIDRANRPVKTHVAVTIGTTNLDSTLTLGNFNAPVAIVAPPADQVAPS